MYKANVMSHCSIESSNSGTCLCSVYDILYRIK